MDGVLCKGEIGRGSSKYIIDEEFQEQSPAHFYVHTCSAGAVLSSCRGTCGGVNWACSFDSGRFFLSISWSVQKLGEVNLFAFVQNG